MSLERLQKVMARAGIGSRRSCEDLIREGRVRVSGDIAELGMKVGPDQDKIFVDGRQITLPPQYTYVLLYKPKGYVTTVKDPQGRPKVTDLVSLPGVRLFPVGRLDYQTSGLLLLTDDGELAYLLTHPKFGVWKTYHVLVQGKPPPAVLQQMREGLPLADGRTAPAKVRFLGMRGHNQGLLQISLREGKKRQVRRMCEWVGHPVIELDRKNVAFLNLEGLRPGEYRFLTPKEVQRLKQYS
ncbi:MAG TPA: pseudouridine synthase [Peptococcaceae bacterium]|nr:pseudouridine synthase [Peptococcaceae bacterium]